MGTRLERIAEISAITKKPEFTSLYYLINTDKINTKQFVENDQLIG